MVIAREKAATSRDSNPSDSDSTEMGSKDGEGEGGDGEEEGTRGWQRCQTVIAREKEEAATTDAMGGQGHTDSGSEVYKRM